MCTIKFLENFFRKIWYLLENNITMLRKAKETKLRLIQEANRRLAEKVDYNKEGGIDEVDVMSAKDIIQNSHKKLIKDLGEDLRRVGMDEDLIIKIRQQIVQHEDNLIKYVVARFSDDNELPPPGGRG